MSYQNLSKYPSICLTPPPPPDSLRISGLLLTSCPDPAFFAGDMTSDYAIPGASNAHPAAGSSNADPAASSSTAHRAAGSSNAYPTGGLGFANYAYLPAGFANAYPAADTAKNDPFADRLNPAKTPSKRADTGAELSRLHNRIHNLVSDVEDKKKKIEHLTEFNTRLRNPAHHPDAALIAVKNAEIERLEKQLDQVKKSNKSKDNRVQRQLEHIHTLEHNVAYYKNMPMPGVEVMHRELNRQKSFHFQEVETYKFDTKRDKDTIKVQKEQIEAQKEQMKAQKEQMEAQEEQIKQLKLKDAEAQQKFQDVSQIMEQTIAEAAQHYQRFQQELAAREADSGALQRLAAAQLEIKSLTAAKDRAERNQEERMVARVRGAARLAAPGPAIKLPAEVLACYECWARNDPCDQGGVCRRCHENGLKCRRWRCAVSVDTNNCCPNVHSKLTHDFNGWLMTEIKRPVW
ncbi:hypothetical protein BU16DRAFT_607588 [Lophium mytilinum]|uniref:Uncharacterized protein n=1 Tax=Lophium mytilinum TaxID=390894 RepID=A0A6A6QXT1_9PEZI|nr:hypothetical protein BU16DRAFT_607588 [Lophium mytilinum]